MYPDNGILFIAKKKKKTTNPGKDMGETYILLSERSQTEKDTYCMIPTMACWKRLKKK
jgi:hypothetical protein